ncbi:hypothetical protein PCK1_002838 [Pneumocystis canis]|nr:hypothetical protein PCK1_002838 [Pneumocystis canis]
METPVDNNEGKILRSHINCTSWKMPVGYEQTSNQRGHLGRTLPYTTSGQDLVGCQPSITRTESVYSIYGTSGNTMNTKYIPTPVVFGYNHVTPYTQLSMNSSNNITINQPFSTVSNISSPPLSHTTPFYSNTGYCQKMPISSNSSNISTISNNVSGVSTDIAGLQSRSNISSVPVSTAPLKHDISDSFMISLMEFMNKRGTPITTIPYIGEQQVNLAALYIHVMRLGGSHKVTQTNAWPNIAQAFGINLALVPNGVQQLLECYKKYIAPYEEAWTYNQQLLMQQQAFSTKPKYELLQEQNNPKKNTDYHVTNQTPSHVYEHSLPSKLVSQPITLPATDNSDPPNLQSTAALSQITSAQVYKPKKRVIETYGGFDMELITKMSSDLENLKCKPPTLHELGTVNIYALTMSIKSGLHSEVNRALDVFTTITGDKRWGLPLSECEELLDSIIEMADDEYNLLVQNVKVMDETMSVLSYEQMINLCYDETENLTVNYRPGSLGYEKIKTAEKILSFCPDSNISSNPNKIIFTPYNPTLHPYLPAAVDTLAKLFAKSFPNRHTFAKVMISISSKQCLRDNIFIRALLLCISPIPLSSLVHSIHTCEMRLALLEHCTLAAETIVSIFPRKDSLAKSLLFADDGFLNNLINLVCLLSSIGGGQLPNQIYNIESNPFSR